MSKKDTSWAAPHHKSGPLNTGPKPVDYSKVALAGAKGFESGIKNLPKPPPAINLAFKTAKGVGSAAVEFNKQGNTMNRNSAQSQMMDLRTNRAPTPPLAQIQKTPLIYSPMITARKAMGESRQNQAFFNMW